MRTELPSPSAYDDPGRARGLDGLRAVAAVCVVAYHIDSGRLPGGFAGVDLFFVISGYVITSLLSAERRRSGRVRLGPFWIRRARRLLPALWAVLVVTACAATLLGGDAVAGLRGNVVAALTYSSNWWQISQHAAYFSGVSGRPVVQHLWSLAMEEQFYLLWPPLLWLIMKLVRRQRHQAALTASMALACFLAMALVYSPDADTSRVYYGTDTHGGGLLLGAAAALAMPLARAATLRTAAYIRTLDALGCAGVVVLVCAAVFLDGTGAATYRGGLALACLGSVALTVAAAAPGRVARTLSGTPLVWLGRRSYGIYLWHWPVIACLGPAADTLPGRIVALVLTLSAATASYRFLEEPVIRLGVRSYVSRMADRFRARATRRPRQAVGAFLAGTGILVVAGYGIGHAPGATALQSQVAAGERASADSTLPYAANPPETADGPAAGQSFAAGRGGEEITAVGDSVMLASADALRREFPGIAVTAKVGRQMDAAPALLEHLRATGGLRRTVLIGLGTNGGFSAETVAEVLRIAGPGRTVAFITVHTPKPWQDPVNAALARAAATRPPALLVDWNAAISHHPEQLWADRTHPRPSGAAAYARTVRAALTAAASQRP